MSIRPKVSSSGRRQGKPALEYAAIVATAVRLVEEEGLEHVTMRRLASEFDTGPASLYVHIANTDQLHAAVLDAYLRRVDLSASTVDGPWMERLISLIHSYIQILMEQPKLAQTALISRPSGPNQLRILEAILQILHDGGVPDDRAAWGVDVLLQVATAMGAEQGAERKRFDAADREDAVRDAVRTVSPRTHPRLAEVSSVIMSGTPEQRLAWIFQVLATGIEATPISGAPAGQA